MLRRAWLGLALVLAPPFASAQQPTTLAESVKPGDCFRIDIALAVDGKLKFERDGRLESLPLKASAAQSLLERVDAPDANGGIGKTVRHYLEAGSESVVGPDRDKKTLGADRRQIVAKRTSDGTIHYSPDGALTREELEIVAEHFDTLAIPALLPGKAVNPGDTWPITNEAAQHACLFDGLVKHDLVGKFVGVKDGIAEFTIAGTAEGTEEGALAKLAINATGKFDVAAKRVTMLTWEQHDERAQGPANPATDVKAVVTIKRSPLAEEPKELSDEARAKVPADDKFTPEMARLRYADPTGRYSFGYDRGWHVVGRTKDHLVIRLVDKGAFVAQATVTAWAKADPGKHSAPADFKAVTAKMPGWEPAEVLADGEVALDGNRWGYRLAARGKQDNIDVVQSFYLIAGPGGDQIAITVLAKSDVIEKLGDRDLNLVKSFALPAAK